LPLVAGVYVSDAVPVKTRGAVLGSRGDVAAEDSVSFTVRVFREGIRHALALALVTKVVAFVLEALFAVLLCVDEMLDNDAVVFPFASGAEGRSTATRHFGRFESLESSRDLGGFSNSCDESRGLEFFNLFYHLVRLHGDGDGDEEVFVTKAPGNRVGFESNSEGDETGINTERFGDGVDESCLFVLGERLFRFSGNLKLHIHGDGFLGVLRCSL